MKTNFYIPASSPLGSISTFIWETESEKGVKETILPRGVVEIIFSFSETVYGVMPYKQTKIKAPRCFIQGIHTHVVQSEVLGKHHLFGMRLQPHKVQQLLGVLPSELNNNIIDLVLIQPQINSLWHQLSEARSFEERVSVLQKEWQVTESEINERSQQLSHLFYSGNTESFQSVDELAKLVCYSPRQLNRVSHQLFGISAEELTGYKKFMTAVNKIHSANTSLTSIAYDAGFYDQSHFIRHFKYYTGFTPNQYKKAKSHLPFHLYY